MAKPNTLWLEVTGSGTAECDGIYCPSAQAEAVSESGTKSDKGYWNGKLAWDRADGKAARSPSISYSNTYKAWRVARLDGHLAYTTTPNTCDDALPPIGIAWDVYKKGLAPAPKIVIHRSDPRTALPTVVFVLGGPGAGKGTMCELAQQQLGWQHFSAGDLLRAERQKGGPNAEKIEAHIKAGSIVPVEITVGLIKEAMAASGKQNFLVDGFPRNKDNADGWSTVMGNDVCVAFMLFFECPLPILEERILKRAKYTQRSDDNVESVRMRFNTYKEETMPIVKVFKEKKQLIEMDSSLPRDEVFANVKSALAQFTEPSLNDAPLTERSKEILGIIPRAKKQKVDE